MIIKKNGHMLTIGLNYMDFIDEETYDKFNNIMVRATYTKAFITLNTFFDFGADVKTALDSLDVSRDVFRLTVEIEGINGGYYFMYDNPAITGDARPPHIGGSAPVTNKSTAGKGRCESIW